MPPHSPPSPQPNTVMAMTVPAYAGISLYCDGSSSWCSAAPMVRISEKTSKPSKVQPRLEAISAFHCVRLSERYHAPEPTVSVELIMRLPFNRRFDVVVAG